jgi:transcriptional regulator with XRE-family HTH domain
MKPEQCRAARALLGMSQETLAERAGVGIVTVNLFEVGKREPYARTLGALRAALESAGVAFITKNGGGPGVRLRKG